MADALTVVFNRHVMDRLQRRRHVSDALRFRLEVLEASGPYPSDDFAAMRLKELLARKSAWEAYLSTARACGMFDGTHGKDLTRRLTSSDDGDFRSAMAECMACWLLAGKLKLEVKPKPEGRNGKTLDMSVALPSGDIRFEVKSTYQWFSPGEVEAMKTGVVSVWTDDDWLHFTKAVASANRQFPEETRNVLVFVPKFKTSVWGSRYKIVEALIGREVVRWSPFFQSGELELAFRSDGHFVNTAHDGPRFTRISAVVCMEEELVARPPDVPSTGFNDVWYTHKVLIAHNPYAKHPVPPTIWGDYPQLIKDGDSLRWTDGRC